MTSNLAMTLRPIPPPPHLSHMASNAPPNSNHWCKIPTPWEQEMVKCLVYTQGEGMLINAELKSHHLCCEQKQNL